MKSLGSDKQENKASKSTTTENCDQIATVEEKIDVSNVKIEPLFEETVDFDTFSKSDFRAVKVKECVAVPKSKKLLQFTLDDGTGVDRTILSGIHSYYEPEELVGKTLIAITNLPPRAMMGIESCGMLLSAVNRAIKRIVDTHNSEEEVAAKKEKREPVMIPRFSCHIFRHTFASRFCENETNIKVIQEVMGHADVSTTMNIYAEANPDVTKSVIEKLSKNMDIF